jgi:hypothetical protein
LPRRSRWICSTSSSSGTRTISGACGTTQPQRAQHSTTRLSKLQLAPGRNWQHGAPGA